MYTYLKGLALTCTVTGQMTASTTDLVVTDLVGYCRDSRVVEKNRQHSILTGANAECQKWKTKGAIGRQDKSVTQMLTVRTRCGEFARNGKTRSILLVVMVVVARLVQPIVRCGRSEYLNQQFQSLDWKVSRNLV